MVLVGNEVIRMSNDLIVNGEEIGQIKSKLTGLLKDNGTKNAELKKRRDISSSNNHGRC